MSKKPVQPESATVATDHDPALAAVEAFDRAFADCASAAERAEALARACAALAPARMRVAIPEIEFSSSEALDAAYRRARGELQRLNDQLDAARRETGYGAAQAAWEAAAEKKIEAEKAALAAEPRTAAGARALLGFVEGYLHEYGDEFTSDVIAVFMKVTLDEAEKGAGRPAAVRGSAASGAFSASIFFSAAASQAACAARARLAPRRHRAGH